MARAIGWAGTLVTLLSTAAWATPSLGNVSHTITGAPDASAQIVPLVVDVSVNPEGGASTIDGAALISGTLFCSQPVQASVYGRVSQKVGRELASGFFYSSFICNGLTPWHVTVVPDNRPFVSGQARVQATGDAYNPDTGAFASDSTEAIIRLRRRNAIIPGSPNSLPEEEGGTLEGEAP
jgi:hypothetical protein